MPSYAIKNLAYPTFYNLLVDPKEEVPELNYLNDTWVDFPLYQRQAAPRPPTN